MADTIELHRVRSGAAGPEGLVLSVAIDRGDDRRDVEVWVLPLNRHLEPTEHQMATHGMSGETALSIVRGEFVRHLDRQAAAKWDKQHPGLEWPAPMELATEPEVTLLRLWLRNVACDRLEEIHRQTGSKTLKERLAAIIQLPRPTIEPF